MNNNPSDGLDPATRFCRQAEDHSSSSPHLYGELCKIETLQLAYSHIRKDSRALGIEALVLDAVEQEGVEDFLQELSNDLQARTYQPAGPSAPVPVKRRSADQGRDALRDQVVAAALKLLLDPVFSPLLPCDPEPEKVISWVASAVERGLTRVYAVTIDEGLDAGRQERLPERISQRVGDADIAGLLRKVWVAMAQQQSGQRLLAPLLANIAYVGIDHMLQKARAVGRDGVVAHVQYARLDHELVILLDQDPQVDWILPAVKKRLREELTALHWDVDATTTQGVDLSRREKLQLLGFELRCVPDSHGRLRVHSKRVAKPGRRPLKVALPSWRLPWTFPRLEFARCCLSAIRLRAGWQFVQQALRQVSSIEVSWRHLPIALYPVLTLLFGWRSPVALLAAVLIGVCNWRSIPVAWGLARRRWLDVTAAACGLAALVCLFLLVSDLSANRSHEATAPQMPPGFYLGQHNSSWGAEPVPYGLYVPPHFKGEKGPLPLIVFLHGYGERTKGRLFSVGVPQSIARRFGVNSKNGRFEFVAFFPIDPTGKWQAGTPEVEDAMRALEHVIQRHRIDPARVYLTGLSNGGSGVWHLAEAYPDRWAAVAPISSFYQPDIERVRHVPAWIFHGAEDKRALVEPERALVRQLRQAGANVRYTEVPEEGHGIWRQMYDSRELYDWFSQHRRKD